MEKKGGRKSGYELSICKTERTTTYIKKYKRTLCGLEKRCLGNKLVREQRCRPLNVFWGLEIIEWYYMYYIGLMN